MNKKFLKVSLSIIICTLAFSLLFKVLLGDNTTYAHYSESIQTLNIKYLGFEEDDNNYRIKVSLTNSSRYYAFINEFYLEFKNVSGEEIGQSIFYGKQEDDYLNKENKVYPYLAHNEERTYCFNISKGLKFDKKVFDTNWMKTTYSAKYYKYSFAKYSAIGHVSDIGGSETINNEIQPFNIE